MGKTDASHGFAERNIRAWRAEWEQGGLDAIVINTSGCGTTVKDYGHMFRETPLAREAAEVAALAKDVTEVLGRLLDDHPHGLPNPAKEGIAGTDAARPVAAVDGVPEPDGAARPGAGLRVAYHAACSLQHGQKVTALPKDLLRRAGFEVVEPRDSHLCCGSAGTYNLMQPEISAQLKARKVRTLEDKAPDVIATGNIGCMMQIGSGTGVPVVHTVELLDWATGGPVPPALGRVAEDAPQSCRSGWARPEAGRGTGGMRRIAAGLLALTLAAGAGARPGRRMRRCGRWPRRTTRGAGRRWAGSTSAAPGSAPGRWWRPTWC